MKSVEFVKNRISNGYTNLNIENYQSLREINFVDEMFFLVKDVDKCWKNNRIQLKLQPQSSLSSDDFKEKMVCIEYDPDANFEYFTMSRCTCDGTLFFEQELVGEIIEKLFSGSTWNIGNIPKDYIERFFNYDIRYVVGNFVANIEHGDFGTDEKPWLNSRFTVFLPIKFEWAENYVFETEGVEL